MQKIRIALAALAFLAVSQAQAGIVLSESDPGCPAEEMEGIVLSE